MKAVLDWLDLQGSTRSAALIRILCGLILWARYGVEISPWVPSAFTPDRILLAVLFYLGTTGMVVGLYSQVSTALTAGCLITMYYHYGWVHEVSGWVSHHTYVVMAMVVLLAFAPSGRSYSLDRWLARRRGDVPREWGQVWPLRLIGLQLLATYWWSVYDKMDPAFLSGHRLEFTFRNYYLGSDIYGPWLGWTMAALAWTTIALELLLPVLLFVRRPWIQGPAFFVGLLLHGVFYVLIPVKTFSVQMFAGYLAFLHPDDVHGILDDLQE